MSANISGYTVLCTGVGAEGSVVCIHGGGGGGPVNHLLSMAAATSLQCLLLFYHAYRMSWLVVLT